MKTVKINFAFDIGDEVIFKGTRGKKRSLISYVFPKKDKTVDEQLVDMMPQVFRVTDRIYEECYGGVQLHYKLRGMLYSEKNRVPSEDGWRGLVGISKEIIQAREIELEAAE